MIVAAVVVVDYVFGCSGNNPPFVVSCSFYYLAAA
jgi:hypothetical protein